MARITSISTLGWAHYTLYQALPSIKKLGFTQVEIASFYSYCFHFNFGSPCPRQLREMFARFKLQPICLNYSTSRYRAWDTSQIDAFVADWTRKLQQLPELCIRKMTMFFGERNNRDDQERQLANAVQAFDAVAEIAKKFEVKMLLEVPHLFNIMFSPEQVYWVFDHLTSGNIGALIDASHWGIIGYDLQEFISRLGCLSHIHLRDSKGVDTADRKQELELTPGDGTVDFRKFAETLDEIGYAGDVSVEFEYRDMTLEAIEHEYQKGLTHLKKCGWELPSGVKII